MLMSLEVCLEFSSVVKACMYIYMHKLVLKSKCHVHVSVPEMLPKDL